MFSLIRIESLWKDKQEVGKITSGGELGELEAVVFLLIFFLPQCGSLDYWFDTIPLFQYILIEIFSAINFPVLF